MTVALTTRAATPTGAALMGGGRTITAVRTPTATGAPGTVTAVRVTPTPTAGTPTATRVTTTMPGNTTVVASSGRPLGSGRVLTVQGSVMDTAGRPCDATITVSNGGGTVGWATSMAGRFSMFDLPPGTYTFAARSTRGTASQSTVSLPAGVARVTVRVP